MLRLVPILFNLIAAITVSNLMQPLLDASTISQAVDGLMLTIDANNDDTLSSTELNSIDTISVPSEIAISITRVQSFLSQQLEPDLFCSSCIPDFNASTQNSASCSFQSNSIEMLVRKNLECIFTNQLTTTLIQKRASSALYRRDPITFIVITAIIGLISVAVSAAVLPEPTVTPPRPIRLTFEPGSGCSGNYNEDSIRFYFNQLLEDLRSRLQNINTGSTLFQTAFPNVAKGSEDAIRVQACFNVISQRKGINFNIERCDPSRLGAAFNKKTGAYQLFGIFDSDKDTRLLADLSKASDTAGKLSLMRNNLSGTFSKLGAILHELTHRYCQTTDEKLMYVDNYAAWQRASAIDVSRNADSYRVFYELVMSE